MNRVVWLSLLFVVAGCSHCGRSPRANRQRPRPPVVHSAFEPPPGTELAAVVDAPTHRAEASMLGNQQYVVGQPTFFLVDLRTKETARFDASSPVRIFVRAPGGLGLTSGSFDRSAAAIDSEHHLAFEIPLVPSQAGEGLADTVVYFSVCQDTTCSAQEAHLRVPITIRQTAEPAPSPAPTAPPAEAPPAP